MKKITYGLIIITIMLFLGLGFVSKPLLANTEGTSEAKEDIPLNITTVSKHQYYMVKTIVKDKHNVEYLISDENKIYEFEYNEDIINNISERDLFIYYGINNEKWINKFIDELKKGDLGIINMSRGIKTLTYYNYDQLQENPYYWLGINEYKIALYNIKSAIQEKDPKNKEFYEKNYNDIVKEIDDYTKEFKTEIEKYKDYTILTNTNTFDYLLRDFGIAVINVKDKVITKRIFEENKLDPNKVIFIKEENPIERNSELVVKKEVEKIEVKNSDEKELELEKPVNIKEIKLNRWIDDKTLIEIVLSNIKLLTDGLKGQVSE